VQDYWTEKALESFTPAELKALDHETLRKALHVISRISSAHDKRNDPQRYGVNRAFHAIHELLSRSAKAKAA